MEYINMSKVINNKIISLKALVQDGI